MMMQERPIDRAYHMSACLRAVAAILGEQEHMTMATGQDISALLSFLQENLDAALLDLTKEKEQEQEEWKTRMKRKAAAKGLEPA
jgi:hypothetical protein